MVRKRYDVAPKFNVKEEGVLIQQQSGSTANLLEIKDSSGSTLMSVSNTGSMSTTLASNAVTTTTIANAAVTTDKIANSAITTDKIANSSITTEKIAANAVVTEDIANGAITSAKLDSNITISGTVKSSVLNVGANTVLGTVQIGDSTITNSDGNIVIGKKDSGGGNRHFKIGYDASFNICIGDYGFNGTAGTWAAAIKMPYDTPDSTIVTNSAGYVRHPTQPRFLADRNGNLAYTPANAVVFNRTIYNVGSHYNTTTGLFQAPVAGTYWFQVGSFQSVAVSQFWWIINGARERSFILENYGLGNLSGMGCLYLNATDTVGVASWSNGSACTIYENIHHTYFRGGLLV